MLAKLICKIFGHRWIPVGELGYCFVVCGRCLKSKRIIVVPVNETGSGMEVDPVVPTVKK